MQKMTIVLGLILIITAVATGVPRVDLEKLHPADGVPGATSQWNPTDHSAGKAFIDNPRVGWCSVQGSMPESIWMKFHRGVKIRKLTFQSRRDAAYDKDEPIIFDVFGSNNEDCKNQEHWVILATDNSETTMTKDDTKMIYIPNSKEGSYRCYGIRVRAVHVRDNGEQFACISHIKFYSDSDPQSERQSEPQRETVITPTAKQSDDCTNIGGNCQFYDTKCDGTVMPSARNTCQGGQFCCAPSSVSCESPGAQMVGGQCLYFSKDTDGKQNWYGAVVACASRGGALAGPIEDPQALLDYIKNNLGIWHGWLAGGDAAEEGVWRWSNGQKANLKFAHNEPNDGTNSNCLYVVGNQPGIAHGYHDNRCSVYQERYVCDLGKVSK